MASRICHRQSVEGHPGNRESGNPPTARRVPSVKRVGHALAVVIVAAVSVTVVVIVIVIVMAVFRGVMNDVVDNGVRDETATGCRQQGREKGKNKQGFDDPHGNAPLQVGP
jgi:hypothetical protein